MDYQSLTETINTHSKVEIRRRQDKFYAVLSVDNHTLGISEAFNTYEAANLAGRVLVERYTHNLRSGSEF